MMTTDSYLISTAEAKRLESVKAVQSASTLIEMLTDPSWIVRRSIVEALAQLGDKSVEPLCETLRHARDSEARIAAAVDALVLSKGKPEAALLRLARDPNHAVVADALQIMGRRRMESAIPFLITQTKHESDIVAVSAIEALGRIGGRASIEALIETVSTGNFFRTFPAIDILGRTTDRRVIEPLAKLLKNPNYLPEAARALGRSGERAATPYLVELLSSPTDSVVRIGVLALWELRERHDEKSGGEGAVIDSILRDKITSAVVRRLSSVMSSFDVPEAVAACNLFGAIRSAQAAPLVTKLLDEPSPIGERAAAALKKIGNESDLHVLEAIRNGDSARRKLLLPIVTRNASSSDVSICLSDNDGEVRALACEALARLGKVENVPDLFRLLEDSNLRVVHSATAALQALGTRESRDLAVLSAKSQNASVRRAAIRILAYFGDEAAYQPIIDALQDSDQRVREVAIQGLPYLENPAAYSALCEVSKNSDARNRALAVRALAQVPKNDELTYSILLKSLSDQDPWVRYYGCQSLGRLAYSSAALEIAALLKDEAGQVRVSAVEALSHLESREAHRALQAAAQCSDVDVKRAALTGLGMMRRNEDLPLVLAAATGDDVSTRLIALSSLINFSSPLVLGALNNAASDPDDQVRSAAINFLAGRSEVEATEILVELLSKESTMERAKTALLVPQVSRSSGLLVALESANDDLASLLISILLRSKRPDAKKALLAALKLDNVAVRKAAAAGMAASRDPEKLAAIQEAATHDPDPEVRRICALLLGE